VLSGNRPRWPSDWQQQRLAAGEPVEVLEQLQGLVEKCWAAEPGDRPYAQQVHALLDGIRVLAQSLGSWGGTRS
jgi:hypothetical protein